MDIRTCLVALVLGTVPALPASAAIIDYYASLSGANENPAIASPGTGFAHVTIDDVLNTMRVEVSFSGLIGGVTAAHIHCCIAPPGNAVVATMTPTFTGFPSGVTAGTYDITFDMTLSSSYRAAFITASGGTVAGAFAALSAGLEQGHAYFNVHTTTFPGGEIRGFLVPEPGTLALLASGLFGLAAARRRKQ